MVVAVLILPFVVYGAMTVVKTSENDVKQWLPKGFEEAKRHTWFTEHFGVDEMIVASWQGCTVDDPRLEQLAEKLREQRMPDGTRIYSRIRTGNDLIRNIQDSGIERDDAEARLAGIFFGPDGKQTCLLAIPDQVWAKDRTAVVENFFQAASAIGLAKSDVHIGGPTVDGAAIDEESKNSLQQFIGLTVLLVFILCWIRLKNLRLAIIVLGFSAYSALLALAVLYWTGGKMNLTMIMLPTLLFILTVSACVHLANYFTKAAERGPIELAAIEALRGGAYPVALSSLTTAIGLASLAASKIMPIQMFGIYSAAGLVISLPLVLIVLPATLHVFATKLGMAKLKTKKTQTRKERQTGVSRRTALFMNWICKNHWLITAPSFVALVLLAYGTQRLKSSVKIQDRFASRTKIIQDYQWLEKHLGPLVPMEVIVRFDRKTNLKESPDGEMVPCNEWDRALMIQRIERRLNESDMINASMSASMFLPPFSKRKTYRAVTRKRISMQMWEQSIPQLVEGKLLKDLKEEQLWRISIRMSAMNDLDYGDFVEVVSSKIEDELSQLNHPGVTAVLTGSIPMMYKAQHQILTDLVKSFLMAFVLITLVLMFVLRSVPAGLVAMVPNVFPPIVVFGAMGWLGLSIEIGSVMTASVALGIAVDDTIHFLTWYRRGTARGLSRFASIRNTFEHCSKAMIDTTLICGLGVACFMLSVFMPTVKFSRLLLVLLSVALVGDLLLLPAILAGPLGKLFRAKPVQKGEEKQKRSPLTEPTSTPKQAADSENLTNSV